MFDRTGIINILSDFGIHAHTLCTHDYQHIAQSIDDLSDPIQQNKLYSSEESALSFTDNTDMHCDYNISAHNSDIPNIDDTYKSFTPKHPAAHSQ